MSYAKQIQEKFTTAINTAELRWSAINTLIITVIIITPLCGFLFQCGCDWPWSGLDSHCNFYQAHAQYHCPWCASMITGVLSAGLTIIAGILVATQSRYNLSNTSPASKISLRTALGVMTFILLSVLSAGAAALLQAYPLGIGKLIVA